MKRKHWSEWPIEEIVYGLHMYGIGPYRINPETSENIEYWVDPHLESTEEMERYNEYLKQNGWED